MGMKWSRVFPTTESVFTIKASVSWRCVLHSSLNKQMYGRYTQELGVYAKEEAARLRDGAGLRRNASVRGRTADVLEYQKDPCTKCQGK